MHSIWLAVILAVLLWAALAFSARAQVPQWQDYVNADSRLWAVQVYAEPNGVSAGGNWYPMGTAAHGDRRILCVVGFMDGCTRMLFDSGEGADLMQRRIAQFPPPLREYTVTGVRLYLHARALPEA